MPRRPARPNDGGAGSYLPRLSLHAALLALAAFFLIPLLVVVLNSVRGGEEIARNGVIGLPRELRWSNFSHTWKYLPHRATLRRHPTLFLELKMNGGTCHHHLHSDRRAEWILAVAGVSEVTRSCSAS